MKSLTRCVQDSFYVIDFDQWKICPHVRGPPRAISSPVLLTFTKLSRSSLPLTAIGRTQMTTGFILDTCVMSEGSRQHPHPVTMDFLQTTASLFIPVAALMEVQTGIRRLCATSPVKAVRLSGWYTRLLASGMPILNTNQAVAEVWGNLNFDEELHNLFGADPRSKRRQGQDVHIAAASLVYQMPVATYNVKDFLMIDKIYPLPGIYHPSEQKWYARREPLFSPSGTVISHQTHATDRSEAFSAQIFA